MLRKNYFIFLTVAALFLASSAMVFGQDAPVKGKVQLKKADGTTAPVEGVTVDIYQTDATGKVGTVKTDAQGMFASAAGVPAGKVFAVVVSAPNINPQVTPDVKGGQAITITVLEGNGEVPTEEEVRDVLLVSKVDPNSAEGKKILAERAKKAAEITAKNEKATNANAVINRALKEGNEAFNAQNYDVAIAKYNEGYNAAPDFVGSAPVMLNGKGNSLRLRGFNSYKKAATDTANKASLMETAKKDFTDAVTAYQQSLSLLAKTPATDANSQMSKLKAQSGVVESYRLLVATGTDQTKSKELAAAANDYAAIETDAAEKSKTLIRVGEGLLNRGFATEAIPVYKKVLEIEPNNADALAGLGLSLLNVGSANEDKTAGKAQMQESLNFLKRFTEVAPDTHPLKASVKETVDYLVNQEKLTPQKVTTTRKKS